MTNRVFISLDIPKNIINELISLRDSIYGLPNNLKWENEDKLHITLKFLGDIGENLTELLIDRFESIAFDSIDVALSNFSFFKKNNQLKILYAAFEANSNIIEFQKIIEDECELLGFSKETRKFLPHLSLLRIRGTENLINLEKIYKTNIDIDKFTISSFSLIKSELKSTGSEYTIMKSFKFI